MDRRAKKLEKKRKSREQAKRKASALAARQPSALLALARTAAHAEFGPCFVSVGWDAPDEPRLVSVLVTRRLQSGHLLAGVALVDRTCLGVKDFIGREPMLPNDLATFVERIGMGHGGMVECSVLIAQSIVFHAIDYASSLGFSPHRDFLSPLFAPRPVQLEATPWSKPARPMFIAGPHDNAASIRRRLVAAVGDDGFDEVELWDTSEIDDDFEADWDEDASAEDLDARSAS
jgi:hypothetical protein